MYLDIILVIIIGSFILTGLKNGLIVEFLSSFGVLISLYLASKLTPSFSVLFKNYFNTENQTYNYIMSFIIVFFILTIAIYIIGIILKNQEITVVMRILGSVMSLAKGILIIVITLTFLNVTQEKFPSLDWITRGSVLNEKFLVLSESMDRFIPEDFQIKLEEIRQEASIKKQLNKLLGA